MNPTPTPTSRTPESLKLEPAQQELLTHLPTLPWHEIIKLLDSGNLRYATPEEYLSYQQTGSITKLREFSLAQEISALEQQVSEAARISSAYYERSTTTAGFFSVFFGDPWARRARKEASDVLKLTAEKFLIARELEELKSCQVEVFEKQGSLLVVNKID